MKNVVIIGNGPAGVSAALYTKRADLIQPSSEKTAVRLQSQIRWRTTTALNYPSQAKR